MQLLERHFDTAFEAPEGIKKLRELILSLAMQGKLVPQDPSDPPASELLKEITAERKRLVKDGKIKESERLPTVTADEVPYSLPKGWEWVRLGTFLQMVNGRAFKPTEWTSTGLPIVRIQNLNNRAAAFNFCDEEDVKEQHIISDNEFLISWSGTPGTSFGAFIWHGGRAALNQHIFRCSQVANPFQDEFLRRAINNRLNFLISLAQGAVGLKHVTKGTLESMPLPLPPRKEQARIVAKIDELMARCEKLEELRAERENRRLVVHEAALQRLMDVGDMDGHIRARDFLDQHFSDLYSVKANVAELRKAFLTLAVIGKLNPQDPNDPPATELLKRIETERRELVKEGKLREPTQLPSLTPKEIPFALPNGWKWTRLDSLLTYGPSNGMSPQAVDYETGVRSLALSATTSGTFKGEFLKFVDVEIPPDSNLWLQEGDILIQRGNTLEYVGVAAIYRGNPQTYIYPDLMMKIRLSQSVSLDYVYYAMSSEFSRDYLRARATGTSGTMPKISQATLRCLPIPLPPLAQQKNITTRINQLNELCDTLELRIDDAARTQTSLLNALIAHFEDQRCA